MRPEYYELLVRWHIFCGLVRIVNNVHAHMMTNRKQDSQEQIDQFFETAQRTAEKLERLVDRALESRQGLEYAFYYRCRRAARIVGNILDHKRSGFLHMIDNNDPVQVAKKLIHDKSPSTTFLDLARTGREHLSESIEAVTLEAEWESLFSDEDRATALRRLRAYGWAPPDNW